MLAPCVAAKRALIKAAHGGGTKAMAQLDSNAAWKEASALVAANRDVLFTIAGVFFLLPSFALAVFVGEPEVAPGATRDQMMATMGEFYGRTWWAIALSSLLQIVGILAILTLMRDRTRPTVGEAIRAGLGGTPTYVGAQLIFAVAIGLVGGVLIAVSALASPVVGAAVLLLVFGAALFLAFRLILVAPIVAVEGERNPVAALRRSWAMTRHNFWRIFAFVILVLVLFLVVLAIVMLIVGLILAVLTAGRTQEVIAALVSSALTSVAIVYFAGMVAAVHRQLSSRAETERSGV
jgi:hypothetical protein